MTRGKIKWFNEVKGYGFIETENGDDVFVHQTGLLNADAGLQPEQQVTFETKRGDRGLIAINVELEN